MLDNIAHVHEHARTHIHRHERTHAGTNTHAYPHAPYEAVTNTLHFYLSKGVCKFLLLLICLLFLLPTVQHFMTVRSRYSLVTYLSSYIFFSTPLALNKNLFNYFTYSCISAQNTEPRFRFVNCRSYESSFLWCTLV